MVNAGVTVVNILAENVLSPVMMSRGLRISPTVVFLAWLLGGPAAFLALPMTLSVAVMRDTLPETHWLAKGVGVSSSEKCEPSP
jgi:predicted PurR-regulated permease PerM